MAYTKTTWVDGITPLSAANFNHMETGIADAHDGIASCEQSINGIMKLRDVRVRVIKRVHILPVGCRDVIGVAAQIK